MGRRVSINRKISKDRVRKIREPKNKILISVEGNNKTERLYFSNFDNGKKSYSISFAKGNYTDPFHLVKTLISETKRIGMDLDDGDKAYCVFDTDVDYQKNDIIRQAKELALENNIQIISSTPCIELWFLLHFEYTTSNMTNRDVISRLKEYYPKYDKNINIYPDINYNIDKAINRAKKLEKYQFDNGKVIGFVEANPNTEIYKLVKELIENKKDSVES